MQKNWVSCNEVVSFFGEKKISDRYRYLYEKLREYIESRELTQVLRIHEGLLQQSLMDYFVDIYRLKTFHKMERIDTNKRIAYEAYWLLRRKPLIPGEGVKDERIIFANEGFVTMLMAHEIMESFAEEPLSEEEEEAFLDYLSHLNYHLKYRNTDKQELELALLSFKVGKKL